MIDNLVILLSVCAVFWVVFRAIVLDRKLPWFGDRPGTANRPTHRP